MAIKTHSIKVYLGCTSFISRLLPGSLGPARGHPQITSPLRGLSRQEPAPNPRRLPLTLDLPSRCVRPHHPLRLEHPSHRRNLRTMFVLAFFSFLRRSEFTTLILHYNPHWHIWLLEVSFFINWPPTILVNYWYLRTSQSTSQNDPVRWLSIFWFHRHFLCLAFLLNTTLDTKISSHLGRTLQFRSWVSGPPKAFTVIFVLTSRISNLPRPIFNNVRRWVSVVPRSHGKFPSEASPCHSPPSALQSMIQPVQFHIISNCCQ